MINNNELRILKELGCDMFDLTSVHPLIGELCVKYEITIMVTPRNKFTAHQKMELMNQGKYDMALRMTIPDSVENAAHFQNLDLILIQPWCFVSHEHIELALLHEIGHHVKQTDDEQIADNFAIEMMSICYDDGERVYQQWLIHQYDINIITGEYIRPNGKYIHRDEYIKRHIMKKRSG